MQDEIKLVKVGSVASCNGRDGLLDLILTREIDLSKEPVYVYIDGLPVPFFCENATRKKNCKWYVKFSDVDSQKDAEELIGKELYSTPEAGELDEEEWDENDFSFLVGWEVWTDKGPGAKAKAAKIGEITNFMDIPSNPCIEIDGEKLIPLAEDFIDRIDEKKFRLYMNLPEGLI